MNKDELEDRKDWWNKEDIWILGECDHDIDVLLYCAKQETRELILAVEELQAENENYREIYYSEHCPHCDRATYPIMTNVKFACPKCKRTFDWKPLWERNET